MNLVGGDVTKYRVDTLKINGNNVKVLRINNSVYLHVYFSFLCSQ